MAAPARYGGPLSPKSPRLLPRRLVVGSWFHARGPVLNDPGCETRYEGVCHITHPKRVSRILSRLLCMCRATGPCSLECGVLDREVGLKVMEGIIWLILALLVALVALGVVLAGIRQRAHNPAHCTSCETPMSLRRVSILRSHLLLGEWICPHCGKRIKRWRSEGTAT